MIILPAIDLINGECVRLVKGDYAKKTVYNADPAAQAKSFAAAGATHMHVVDLDGAKDAFKTQKELIKKLARAVNLKIETGGGIRTYEHAKELLDAGIDKVIIGSLAVRNPAEIKRWIAEFDAQRVVLSLDVFIKEGAAYVADNAWQTGTNIRLEDLVKEYSAVKNLQVLCTDISKDGMMAGPNFELYKKLKNMGVFVIASGGVSSIEDLKKLKDNKADAAIIGKALYEGKIKLEDALKI